MHVACNFSFIVKNEGVLKVIVSHVHFKSGSISGTELDRGIATTGHKQNVIYGLRKSSNCDVCKLQGHLSIAIIFKWDVL